MLTRPKDGIKRRVILNLSYPEGFSVNDHVCAQKFENLDFILKFPTIDDITTCISSIQDDVSLANIDIERAFRNIPIDPADSLKLGFCWRGKYYIDKYLAFGCVSTPY